MESLEVFLSMGGHARFVWPAYAIAALAMVGLVVVSLRGLRAREAELRLLERDNPRRRGAGEGGPDDA